MGILSVKEKIQNGSKDKALEIVKFLVSNFEDLRPSDKENLRALCDSMGLNPEPIKNYKKEIHKNKKFDLQDTLSLTSCFNLAIDLINKDVELLRKDGLELLKEIYDEGCDHGIRVLCAVNIINYYEKSGLISKAFLFF